MLNPPAAVLEFFRQQSIRPAIVWEIERRDGEQFFFTAHDVKLTVEGQEYTPLGAVEGSAARREGQLVVHDREFNGALESAQITEEDLRGEKFHDAIVTERWVDWRYPEWGVIATFVYWIGDVTFDGRVWQCSVEGVMRFLAHEVGDIYSRNCRHDLGVVNPLTGIGCPVNLATFTIAGLSPYAFGDGDRRQVIRLDPGVVAGSGTYADTHFSHGYIVVATGANAGIRGDIKRYFAETRQIELFRPLPYPMATTDTFILVAGCDKLFSTCKTKFNQAPSFGAWDLPGSDAVFAIKLSS